MATGTIKEDTMPLSKKTRFEVFKRDGFTCSYCGRTPPTVTLEVDHIFPVSEGGSDELENLATSCFDCNRGKGAGLLDDRAPVMDIPTQTALIVEREEQLRAYHEAKEAAAARRSRDVDAVWTFWFDLWNVASLQKWETPWESVLRRAVDVLGTAEVKEAMQITRDRFDWPTSAAPKYFGGIIRKKIARAEGRVVSCEECGKDVILNPGDDPSLLWWHKGCLKKSG